MEISAGYNWVLHPRIIDGKIQVVKFGFLYKPIKER